MYWSAVQWSEGSGAGRKQVWDPAMESPCTEVWDRRRRCAACCLIINVQAACMTCKLCVSVAAAHGLPSWKRHDCLTDYPDALV